MKRIALLLLFVTFVLPYSLAQTLPQLPQVYVDTTMPVVNGSTFYATACTGAGVGIQDRINAAAAADGSLTHVVIITSSLSCSMTLTLPVKNGINPNGAGWIIVESSALANLPLEGVRVDPSYAQYMPKILGPAINAYAVVTAPRAHHYRFIGIEFSMAPGITNSGPIVSFGADPYGSGTITCAGTSCTTSSPHGVIAGDWITITSGASPPQKTGQQVASANGTSITLVSPFSVDPVGTTWRRVFATYPSYLVLDRSYVHGLPTKQARRGVQAEANYAAIIDSYISDIHDIGSDTQAISGENFDGPLKIVNNYLEAAGENIIFGGSGNVAPGHSPSDIEIRRNYVFKPLSWRVGDPSYAGYHWSIKNSLELKHAKRVLIEGNIFEHTWLDAQYGVAIVITPRIDSNSPCCTPAPAPIGVLHAVTDDITIRYNRIISASNGMGVSGRDSAFLALTGPGPSQANRIWIHDNLLEDISGANWGAEGRIFRSIMYGVDDLRIDHNTGFQSGAVVALGEDPANTLSYPVLITETRFVFQDNIFPYGNGGITSPKGIGTAALNYFTPGYTFLKNIIVGASTSSYPPNNSYPAGPMPSNISFVNYNNGTGGDYHLAAGSPYKNAATDGKDIGADIDAVNQMTAGAVAGIWNSSYTPPPPPPPSTCSDGTTQSACSSASIGKYCSSQLQLIDSCSTNLCGCPSGQQCNATSQICYTPVAPPPPVTCGTTPASTCMSTKPQYCDSTGTIVDKCSLCTCPTGYMCQTNEACAAQTGAYTKLTIRGRMLRNTASQTACSACSITIGLLGVSNTTTTASDGTFTLDLYKAVSPSNYIFDITVNDGTKLYVFKRRGTIV